MRRLIIGSLFSIILVAIACILFIPFSLVAAEALYSRPKVCLKGNEIQKLTQITPEPFLEVNSTESGFGDTNFIAVQNHYTYFGIGSGLAVLDVSDPTEPYRVGYVPLPHYRKTPQIEIINHHAYIVISGEMWVIDISNPTTPTKLGVFNISGAPQDMTVGNTNLYITSRRCSMGFLTGKCSSALHILDISNPVSPVQVGCYETPGTFRDVAVLDNFVYISHIQDTGLFAFDKESRKSLFVINISNPKSPTKENVVRRNYTSRDMNIFGEFAYLLTRGDGIKILAFEKPSKPVEVGSYDWNHGAGTQVVMIENYAYIPVECVSDCVGLRIVDVSNPANPVEAGFYNTEYTIRDLAVESGYMYVVKRASTNIESRFIKYENGSLRVLDISNPAIPVEVGIYSP